MESALTEFFKHRTTIAQSQELVDPDEPVLVACPYPPFKPSFFKEQGIGFHPYFWGITGSIYSEIRRKLEKVSSMMNAFTNMSYKLGNDWNIGIMNQDFRYLLFIF